VFFVEDAERAAGKRASPKPRAKPLAAALTAFAASLLARLVN
jgi:hypothetical protein